MVFAKRARFLFTFRASQMSRQILKKQFRIVSKWLIIFCQVLGNGGFRRLIGCVALSVVGDGRGGGRDKSASFKSVRRNWLKRLIYLKWSRLTGQACSYRRYLWIRIRGSSLDSWANTALIWTRSTESKSGRIRENLCSCSIQPKTRTIAISTRRLSWKLGLLLLKGWARWMKMRTM